MTLFDILGPIAILGGVSGAAAIGYDQNGLTFSLIFWVFCAIS